MKYGVYAMFDGNFLTTFNIMVKKL